jgi:hypothetical protein
MHITVCTDERHPDPVEQDSLFHNISSWISGTRCHQVVVWFSGKFVCILSVVILKKQIEVYRYKVPLLPLRFPSTSSLCVATGVGVQITDPYNTGSTVCLLLRFVYKQAMYIYRDIEVHSCNHCCCGKAILCILCVCACVCVCSLSYPACSLHVLYYIVICALSGFHFFPCYLINGTIKKNLLDINCVFWFSVQVLSVKFLILRRIQWDIINVHMLSSRNSCHILMKHDFFLKDLWNTEI